MKRVKLMEFDYQMFSDGLLPVLEKVYRTKNTEQTRHILRTDITDLLLKSAGRDLTPDIEVRVVEMSPIGLGVELVGLTAEGQDIANNIKRRAAEKPDTVTWFKVRLKMGVKLTPQQAINYQDALEREGEWIGAGYWRTDVPDMAESILDKYGHEIIETYSVDGDALDVMIRHTLQHMAAEQMANLTLAMSQGPGNDPNTPQ
jgi:hypothetical protein